MAELDGTGFEQEMMTDLRATVERGYSWGPGSVKCEEIDHSLLLLMRVASLFPKSQSWVRDKKIESTWGMTIERKIDGQVFITNSFQVAVRP